MLQKVQIILKNTSNKNCSELNFLQKTQWTHISISPRSGGKGSKDLWLNLMEFWWKFDKIKYKFYTKMDFIISKICENFLVLNWKLFNKNLKVLGDKWRNFKTSLRIILKNVLCCKNFLTIFFSQGPFLHYIALTISVRLQGKFKYNFFKIFLK